MKRIVIFLSALFTSGCISTYYYSGEGSIASYSKNLRDAQVAVNEDRLADAISLYREHILTRLNAEDRADWENPYFYYLIIADLYLRQEKPDRALQSIEAAKANRVDPGLISDRFRLVAHYYEQRREFEEAISILEKYRESDPLLFDLMRDRIARMIVALEEEELQTSPEGDDSL